MVLARRILARVWAPSFAHRFMTWRAHAISKLVRADGDQPASRQCDLPGGAAPAEALLVAPN